MPVSDGYTYTVIETVNCQVDDYDPSTSSGGYTPSIPSTLDGYNVTVLIDGSFESKNLTGVTIPSSVTTIEQDTFKDNEITSLTLDYAVDLGVNCFAENTEMTSLTINADVTTTNIGFHSYSPFYNNNIDTGLTIGASVTSLPDYIFAYSGITSFTIPSYITSLPRYCFYECDFTSITIPSTLTYIDEHAFAYNEITSLTLDYAIDLDVNCFAHNTEMTSLTINADVTTTNIGHHSYAPFYNNNIDTGLTIGASVTSLPDYIFAYSGITSFTIPSNITSLPRYCFYECDFTSITIPSTLTYIEAHAFAYNEITSLTLDYAIDLDVNCFAHNTEMTSLTINADVTNTNVSTNTYSVFYNCDLDSGVTISNSVTVLPNYFLANSGITSITIPTGITTIPRYCFYNCDLTGITIPSNITTIIYNAFDNNEITSLTLDYPVELGAECFKSNTEMTSLTINANITTNIGYASGGSFNGCDLDSGVTISNSVTSLGNYLLAYSGITSITIPSGLTTLSNSLFYSCDLTSITIPSNITTIGYNTFQDNEITSLTLDYPVELGAECFKNNTEMTSLTINADITTNIGYASGGSFNGCDLDSGVTIGTSVTTIPSYIFSYAGLTSISFPENVTSIGNLALYNNDDLATIYVYNDSVTFGTSVLDGSTPSPMGTIYGYSGSTTETWAAGYSTYYNFVALVVPPTTEIDFLAIEGQLCRIKIDDTLRFTGIITNQNYKKSQENINQLEQNVSVSNLKSILARRTIRVNYDEGDLTSDIIEDMVDTYLYTEGITKGTISTGIALGEMWLDDCINIYDVIDQMASKNGFQWYIDKNLQLHCYQDPTTITDADEDVDADNYQEVANLEIEGTLDNYVNKIFIVGGNDTNGNQVFAIRGDLDAQNAKQEECAGSGVYGTINRDSSNVETEIEAAESGTTTTNITITGIGDILVENDFIWNITRDAYTLVSAVVDSDNVTVEAVTSQTTGDEIAYYPSCNKISENELKKLSVLQRNIKFVCDEIDFLPSTRLKVTLPAYGIDESYYNIESVNIINEFGNKFKAVLNCKLREHDNFSTQKTPSGINFFKDF